MKIFRKLRLLFLLLSVFFSAQTDELPIMAFHSFTPQTSNLMNFKKFKEAGFNINHTIFRTNDQVQNALNLAQKVGIKMIIYSDELLVDTENTVKKFRNHPALFAYFLADEPSPKDFESLQRLIEKVKKLDSKHPIYINLHPNYAPSTYLGNLSYNVYVDKFLKTVNVEILSFDNYPLADNKILSTWYDNLEIIRNNSQKNSKPFWAFANTTIFNNYRQPTLGGLKLQQFSNLLYGAKGLHYFTYITMDDEYWKKHNFGYAIVHNNGKPTPTCSLVKNLNQQIKNLSWIFTKSKVDSVFHIGDTIPVGTKRLNFLPNKFKVFKTFGRNALVSFQSIGTQKFIIIQNKDVFKTMPFNYQAQLGVYVIDNKTGKRKTITTNANISSIPPGDIRFLHINKESKMGSFFYS